MIKKEKAIVVLIPGFAASEDDSTCIPFAQSFIRSISSKADPVKIIIIAFQYPFRSDAYYWHNIIVHPLNGKNRGKFVRLQTWKKGWDRYKKIDNEFKVIGILSFWLGECALLGKLLHKKYKVPFYTWLMGQDARKKNPYQRLIRPAPENIIALSDFLAKEYQKNYTTSPAHIIPLGTDEHLFHVNRIRHIQMMAAGSLISLKRFDEFIKLIALLKSKGYPVTAVLCGDGPLRSELMHLAASLGVVHEIEFRGELPNLQVIKLMAQSRIFVHTSSYEGNSTVCAEALAAGAHVVSYCQPMLQVSAHHHIVHDFSGMARKTEELLQSETLDHTGICDYTISETSNKVLKLFCQH